MARELIGCVLETAVDNIVTSGAIVETEAYLGPDDPAAHGYGNRKTNRNAAMFGPPGNTYVYFIYGMHWCFNAVTEAEGYPAAVLVRALEPLSGLKAMRDRRQIADDRLLCAGPARLCRALGIDRRLNDLIMPDPEIAISSRASPVTEIDVSPRVGISQAADWPLRFVAAGSVWRSR